MVHNTRAKNYDGVKLPVHYGKVAATKITDSGVFWSIMDELEADYTTNNGKGFYVHRTDVLDACMRGLLYGLEVEQTDDMVKNGSFRDNIFMNSWRLSCRSYFLPCFVVVDDRNCCHLLWVAERARRLGFGRKLVRDVGIKSAQGILDKAIPFWQKMDGVNIEN